MRYLLTTCCAAKLAQPGLVPAAERYLSPRIELAKELARQRGLPLLILSGVHGVLRADEGVPAYDHALRADEVEGLIPRVVDRLRELGATFLVLVYRRRGTPGWGPYLDVIDAAVEELGLSIERVVVDVE